MLSKTISTSRSASFLVSSAARATSSTSSAFVITISRYSCRKGHQGPQSLKRLKGVLIALDSKCPGLLNQSGTVSEKGGRPQDKLYAPNVLGSKRKRRRPSP